MNEMLVYLGFALKSSRMGEGRGQGLEEVDETSVINSLVIVELFDGYMEVYLHYTLLSTFEYI